MARAEMRATLGHVRGSHPLWRPLPGNLYRDHLDSEHFTKLQFGAGKPAQISNLSFSHFTRRY